jgi:hypothetical protein
MSANLAALFYLGSGILFILALRGLSSPETSRQGNYYGMAGMALAVVTTLFFIELNGLGWILVALAVAIGGGVGAFIARNIPMTAMPQLVAAFHSLSVCAPCWSPPPRYTSRPPLESPAATPARRSTSSSSCPWWNWRWAQRSARSPSPARSSPS